MRTKSIFVSLLAVGMLFLASCAHRMAATNPAPGSPNDPHVVRSESTGTLTPSSPGNL